MSAPHIPFYLKFSQRVSAMNELIGKAVSWLVLLMVLVIVYDVSMRYLFHIGSVLLQELEWHFFDIVFLLGAAYTLKENSHVSIDILYGSRLLSDQARLWINILGTLLFLIPFSILVIHSSIPFVEFAYQINEGSSEPGGLPFRFLIKAMIPLSFFLLILQGICYVIESAMRLKKLASKQESA
jgi:TRAP-type mannitol/chloroaromatic compound transport system permease small subunit